MATKFAHTYKMNHLYLKKAQTGTRAKVGEEIQIGTAFFRVIASLWGWNVLECLVDWSREKGVKNFL